MLELRDAHARVARDLRVSLTDRCNLRCVYCMPAEGMQWIPRDETLTDDEVVRLIRVGVEQLGITKVRFTGGEPLIRPGLASILARVKQLRLPDGTAPETALTTNGIGLAPKVEELRDAGLDRVNISIDSLDEARYAQMSRRNRLPDVLEAIEASHAAGLRPVKVNAVIMRGINEVDVVPLAEFALKGGYELRFIEQMPLGPKGEWHRHDMVTAQELLDALGARFQLSLATEPRGAAPAELWSVAPDDTQPGGHIGVIASVSHPFCANCDRTRITSDGQIRTCLFSRTETDLRGLLRSGADDATLAEAWAGAHRRKPQAHGIDTDEFEQPQRGMSAIGG